MPVSSDILGYRVTNESLVYVESLTQFSTGTNTYTYKINLQLTSDKVGKTFVTAAEKDSTAATVISQLATDGINVVLLPLYGLYVNPRLFETLYIDTQYTYNNKGDKVYKYTLTLILFDKETRVVTFYDKTEANTVLAQYIALLNHADLQQEGTEFAKAVSDGDISNAAGYDGDLADIVQDENEVIDGGTY